MCAGECVWLCVCVRNHFKHNLMSTRQRVGAKAGCAGSGRGEAEKGKRAP